MGDQCPMFSRSDLLNELGVLATGGQRYFYLVSNTDEPVTHLYVYNLAERTNTRLFTSEINTILGTSPDERYIVLTLGERLAE